MGYKVPALDKNLNNDSSDIYALEVLASILSNSSTSRLNRNLVNTSGVAVSASAGYAMLTRGGLSLFEFYATPSCLLYTSPSPRDKRQSRMPSSA